MKASSQQGAAYPRDTNIQTSQYQLRSGTASTTSPYLAGVAKTTDNRTLAGINPQSSARSLRTPPARSNASTSRADTFPNKLHIILGQPEYASVIGWKKDGKSFSIKDPGRFTKEVMPKFFKTNRLKSIKQQLREYSFNVKTETNGSISIKHANFVRDKEALATLIQGRRALKAQRAKQADSKKRSQKNTQPDGRKSSIEARTEYLFDPTWLNYSSGLSQQQLEAFLFVGNETEIHILDESLPTDNLAGQPAGFQQSVATTQGRTTETPPTPPLFSPKIAPVIASEPGINIWDLDSFKP